MFQILFYYPLSTDPIPDNRVLSNYYVAVLTYNVVAELIMLLPILSCCRNYATMALEIPQLRTDWAKLPNFQIS